MAGYNDSINRPAAGAANEDVLVPEQISREILQELPGSSAMMARARKAQMSTKSMKQPVLSALPDAYWLAGDSGLKQTTTADWKSLVITAEELAGSWSSRMPTSMTPRFRCGRRSGRC